jgi:hypothetical protein
LAVADNRAPIIYPIVDQYVMEGDSLILIVYASDLEKSEITLSSIKKPFNSIFVDLGNGKGRFAWRPDYAGPNSSHGSPFEISFMANDGEKSAIASTKIYVLNCNRKPIIESPEAVFAFAGETITIDLTGVDADNDLLTWTLINAPIGSKIQGDGRAVFSWPSGFNDVGIRQIQIVATDKYGLSDTALMTIQLAETDIYTLSIDTLSVYPGEQALININLNNLARISGFDILINYDISALSLVSVSKTGTRSKDFEYFVYQLNPGGMAGDVRITGIADVDYGVAGNLPVGDGSLCKILFCAASDWNFSGNSIPLRFIFRDFLTFKDNTLTDSTGATIPQTAISYNDGFVFIRKADQNSLGDINLNGIAYEIGDITYLTNYFLNPGAFDFNAIQRTNSDVNQDGYAPSIADLVYMINAVANLSLGDSKLSPYPEGEAVIYAVDEDGCFNLKYDSPVNIGGMAMTLSSNVNPEDGICVKSAIAVKGMVCDWRIDGSNVRLLIYGEKGSSLPEGTGGILTIESRNRLMIDKVEAATADGRILPVVLKTEAKTTLPGGFELRQNFPNPFNPSTTIGFDLPAASDIQVVVYDLLGKKVRSLMAGKLEAGHHEYIWDGKNDKGDPLPSGVYFYRLQGEGFSSTRKMLLLK